MVHVFVGNVHHDKKKFVKGQAVPADILEIMKAKGLARELEQPKAVEPVVPPEDAAKAAVEAAAKAKLEAEAKAKADAEAAAKAKPKA